MVKPNPKRKHTDPGADNLPFAAFLERISDGFVVFDAQMNYRYVNQRAGEMLGRVPKDLLGKNYWVEYPEAKGTPFAEAYTRALETQETIVLEDYYAPWDRWFENRIYPSQDGLSVFFTEITERKQAEIRLHASEERLKHIVETMPDGIAIVARNGAIAFANPPAEQILGLNRADITQRFYNDPQWSITAVNGEPFPDENLPFARVKASRRSVYNVEHAIVYPDGRRVTLSVNASPLQDAKGNFEGMVASFTNITERRQLEILLAGEKQVLEMIAKGEPLPKVLVTIACNIESQSDGMFCTILLLDSDGLHVRHGAAPSMKETFIRAIDGQPIGPNAGSCGTAAYRKEPVYVTDIASDPLWEDYRQVALEHGLRACWSTPIKSSEGRVLGTFAMYYGEPRTPEPADLRLIEFATHLAGIGIERKRVEESLQGHRQLLETVVNYIPASVSLLRGSDLRLQLINPAYQAIAPGKEMLGKTWDELWDETGQNFTAICHQVLETGEPYKVVDEPNMIRRAPDEPVKPAYFSWSLHRVQMPGNEGWGLLGTAWETTERKHAEDEVRLSRDRLAELSRQLVQTHETESRAIGRELHDQIGQMLTALKLIMEIAPQLPPELRDRKHAQARELVDDLMNRVSRLSLELRPPMLDDLGLIPALLWHVNRYQEQTSIPVEFKHSGAESKRFGSEIETTAYRLVQEALTNVARHAHAAHARLEVHVGGGWMEITIEDDGAGFEPQAALDQHRGLSGMRERVYLLGGSFQIETQPGIGTKIFIQLPLTEKIS